MSHIRLHRPSIKPDIISRPRISNLLNENSFKQFVLVCAPAGYGKSIAVSQWLEHQSKKYVWLSLEEKFDEIISFWKSLNEALDQLSLEIPSESEKSILDYPGILQKVMSNSVFEKIQGIQQASILVLDDYHLIRDNQINALMDTILEYLPDNLQIIMITQRDPSIQLHRLRLYGKLVDIRMTDLALDFEEFQCLLTSSGQKNISVDEVQRLLRWTEGWILGIKIAMSFKSHSGNQLPRKNSDTLSRDIDFFVDQLTSNLDDDVSNMIKTVALCTRFNEELIESILAWKGIQSKDGHTFLQHLKENNLFIIDLDSEGVWYRFHHLFRDLLVKQLFRENLENAKEALEVVTRWFTNQNLIDEAIQMAVIANDFELATSFIVDNRFEIFNKDQWWLVQSWINILPDRIRKSNIELLLAQLWIFENTMQVRDMSATLNIIENQLKPESDPALTSEFYFHLGWYEIFILSDIKNALMHLEKSKQLFRGNTIFEARREHYIALSRQMSGEFDYAFKSLDEIEKKYLPTDLMYIRTNLSKMFILLVEARFRLSRKVAERSLFLSKNCDFEAIKAYSWYLQTNVAFQTFEYDIANHSVKMAISFPGVLNVRVHFDAFAGFCIWHSLNGNVDVVDDYMHRMEELTQKLQEARYWEYIQSIKSRLQWHEGTGQTSLPWALKDWKQPNASEYLFALDFPAFTKLRIILTYGSPLQIDEGLKFLEDIETQLHTTYNHYHDVDILIMKAIGAFRKEDINGAREYMTNAVQLAESQGIVRPIIELCRVKLQIVELVDKSTFSKKWQRLLVRTTSVRTQHDISRKQNSLVEILLTIREREIVGMTAKGLRNKEIAEELHISEVTVKSHLTNIYRKFNVTNRTTMVQKARDLHLAN